MYEAKNSKMLFLNQISERLTVIKSVKFLMDLIILTHFWTLLLAAEKIPDQTVLLLETWRHCMSSEQKYQMLLMSKMIRMKHSLHVICRLPLFTLSLPCTSCMFSTLCHKSIQLYINSSKILPPMLAEEVMFQVPCVHPSGFVRATLCTTSTPMGCDMWAFSLSLNPVCSPVMISVLLNIDIIIAKQATLKFQYTHGQFKIPITSANAKIWVVPSLKLGVCISSH